MKRRDIFDWLDEEIDSMFKEIEFPSWNIQRKCLEPLIQIREGDKEIIITADLPCVEREDIEVSSIGNSIEIKAKMRKAVKFSRWGTIQKDIGFESFHRVIDLPIDTVPEKIRAKFRKGILEIRVPKKHVKKQIKIE